MRERSKLTLSLAVVMIVIGATGLPEALATLPPSSGTPTPISAYYGSIVIGTSFLPSGCCRDLYLYIFSTSGPFYVERVTVGERSTFLTMKPVVLLYVFFDETAYDFYGTSIPPLPCPQIIAASNSYGYASIIAPGAGAITDPSGAQALPVANALTYDLEYNSCTAPVNFPAGIAFIFEATVLAPTAATVSICASETQSLLASCPIT